MLLFAPELVASSPVACYLLTWARITCEWKELWAELHSVCHMWEVPSAPHCTYCTLCKGRTSPFINFFHILFWKIYLGALFFEMEQLGSIANNTLVPWCDISEKQWCLWHTRVMWQSCGSGNSRLLTPVPPLVHTAYILPAVLCTQSRYSHNDSPQLQWPLTSANVKVKRSGRDMVSGRINILDFR